MNNIDGYYHQIVSRTTLMQLTVNFHGSGWTFVPMSLFPSLVAGRPAKHWGCHGIKVTDLRAALQATEGNIFTLNWDGYHTFIMIAQDGYQANLTVYPRHKA